MMNFVFSPAIQAGIVAGKYLQVLTSAGVPIGMVRDSATGQFVAHAIGAVVQNGPLSPLVFPMELIMGGLQMYQNHLGFKAIEASLGVLQATTAVIGVGTAAGVALSAVNLYHTLKLKQAVERLEIKVENGFISLEQILKDQGTEIKQLIYQVLEEIKFEQHRLVLVQSYGQFTQAIQMLQSALKIPNINDRNANIVVARGMLFQALANYRNQQILDQTSAPGQLRRLECCWAIEQSIIGTYQVQNELEAAGDRIFQMQQQIREDSLKVIASCNSDEELDFLFPEITRIYNHDLVGLDIWQNQIEWAKTLPQSELKELQTANFSKGSFSTNSNEKSDPTVLPIPDEQLIYEQLRLKSHSSALRTQLELMLIPQQRREYEAYIQEQGKTAGHKSLVPSNLEKASLFAIANLYHYFKK